MLSCVEPAPAPPDEAALLAERAQLIALLRDIDQRIREARERQRPDGGGRA